MKRLPILTAIILLILALSSCSASNPDGSYTVETDGKTFTIYPESNRISDGEYTYTYQPTGRGVNITYPNKATYQENRHSYSDTGTSSSAGWSDNYDDKTYTSGDILADALEKEIHGSGGPSMGDILISLLLAALGLWHLFLPENAWQITRGWKYKNAEPTDTALLFTRISGALVLVVAVMKLFS